MSAAITVGLCLIGQQASAQPAHLTAQQADAQPPRVTYADCGGGIQRVFYTPAAGFDPLTATDAELAANGLPIRPADPADLGVWRTAVTHPVSPQSHACDQYAAPAPAATALPATRQPATAPAIPTSTTANWAGYKVTGHTYEDAYGYWTLQNTGTPPPDFAALSSQWIGIGQGSRASLPLVQAGTESDINEGCLCETDYMWWEVVPQFGHEHVISLGIIVRFGNVMYAHIHLSPNNAYITLIDVTDSNAGATYRYNLPHGQTIRPDGTAEWINERPSTILHEFFPLAKGSITFTSADVSGAGVSKRGAGTLPRTAVNMFDCTNPKQEIARPLGFVRNGTQFTVQWLRYGHFDHC